MGTVLINDKETFEMISGTAVNFLKSRHLKTTAINQNYYGIAKMIVNKEGIWGQYLY